MNFILTFKNTKKILIYFTSIVLLSALSSYVYFYEKLESNSLIASHNKENSYKYTSNHILEDLPKPSAIYLRKEEIYNYITQKTRLISLNYLQMLNETLKFAEFPDKILIQENSLPFRISTKLHIKHNKTILINGKKVRLPIFTANPNGRLGNLLAVYASEFALGKLYNVSVFLSPDLKNSLINAFPSISMENLPSDFNLSNCVYLYHETNDNNNYSPLEFAAAGLFGPKCFVLNGPLTEISLMNAIKKDIIKEFKFSSNLSSQASAFMSSVKAKAEEVLGEGSFTYIGLHIRRTDYKDHVNWYKGVLPGFFYINKALNIYRKRYKNPVFVAASDDFKFIKRILNNEKDVLFSAGLSPELDMAVLSSCNHSIFSVGSFGFWSAYLTGGDVMFADAHTEIPYIFSKSFYDEANLTNFETF